MNLLPTFCADGASMQHSALVRVLHNRNIPVILLNNYWAGGSDYVVAVFSEEFDYWQWPGNHDAALQMLYGCVPTAREHFFPA